MSEKTERNRIKKVKYKQGKDVEITIDQRIDHDLFIEKHIKGKYEPHPDFYKAMQANRDAVMEEANTIDVWLKESILIGGISFAYSEATGRSAVITAEVKLECSDSPMNINLPSIKYEDVDGTGETYTFSTDALEKLEKFEKEIWLYLDGKKYDDLQGDIFEGDMQEEDAPEMDDDIKQLEAPPVEIEYHEVEEPEESDLEDDENEEVEEK